MSKWYFSLSILFVSFSICAQPLVSTYSANAVDKNGNIQYTENYELTKNEKGESLKIKTTYLNLAGKKIAELESDFQNDPYIPETVFTDFRFNEKQTLHYDPKSKIIQMKLLDMKTGKFQEKKLKREDNMVSGQGFHNFILKNFELEKSDIKFIVLSKLDFFSFKLESSSSETPSNKRFVLKISNWLLRAMVQQITVDYRINDKTLLKFAGLTNIEADNRDSQILTIQYPL